LFVWRMARSRKREGAAFISAYGGVEGANVDALVDHDPKLGG
jgi:hypothetical protein